MAIWRRRLVRVAGVGLHVQRAGLPDAPPVLALHGIGDDGGCWEAVARDLVRDHDVVLLDARGHGRSDAPARGYTTDDHVSDVVGVIAALGLQQPVLLGHSMGAITALVVAGQHPTVPAAVVLEDPPAWWARHAEPEPERLARTERLLRTVLALKRRTHAELMEIQGEAAPGWSPTALERWAEATQRLAPQVAWSLPEQHRANLAIDWPVLLAAVRCPALLLHGDRARGGALSPQEAAMLAGWVADVEVVALDGGGHALRHERPAAYQAAVRGFLTRTTGGGAS